MASTESEDFRQAARECMHLAAETTESEIKASYVDLAGSYQHLADKTTMWAAGIETERVILDAARTSLAVQKIAVHFSEQPLMALSALTKNEASIALSCPQNRTARRMGS
jgi:hypothetical protein